MKKSDGKDIFSIEWEPCQAELQYEIEENKKRIALENERIQEEKLNLLKQNMEEEYNKKKKEMEEELRKKKRINYHLW